MFQVFTCLTTEHDWRLVILAGLVCLTASLTGISLFKRAQAATGRTRVMWIVGAGAAAGCGIWATHFIAMLSYEPSVPVAYDVVLTILSLVVAACVTGIGFATAIFAPARVRASIGGAVIGAGVASMHYLGMAALEVPGRVTWTTSLVIASIALGIAFGMAAVLVVERMRGKLSLLAGALLLTLAIVSHHFTAMGAVQIVPDPIRGFGELSVSPFSLALVIASTAIGILGVCLVGAFADRATKEKLMLLNDALDHMSQGLTMFDEDGRLVLWNRRYVEMYSLQGRMRLGCTLQELMQQRAETGTLNEDPVEYAPRAKAAALSGSTFRRVVELPNGRKVATSNTARSSGGWVSTHEDITEQEMVRHERVTIQNEHQRRALIDSAIAEFRPQASNLLNSVKGSVGTMRTTAHTLLENSRQTSQRAVGAVSAFDEASTNVSAVAAAANELSASITEISNQLSHTADVVRVAATEAEATDGEITGLSAGAEKIGEVVSLIRQIAAQTNLFALNATIEAARAGEAGRGFSVVASEVKSLAVQTAKATEDIAQHILGVQNSTSSAVATIQRIASRMQEINQCTNAVTDSITRQSAATSEISHNVAGAASGTGLVSAVLSEVAGAANEAQQSAQIVLEASERVEKAVSNLQLQVEQFLAKVAA